MKYSQRLKKIIEETKITQEMLARDLEVTFAALNRWINGIAEPRQNNKNKIDVIYSNIFPSNEVDADLLSAGKAKLLRNLKNYNLKILMSDKDFVKRLALSMTYTSNRLEGSTMTIEEVEDVLMYNRNYAHRSLIEHIEAKNHEAAFYYVLDNKKTKLTHEFVKRLSSILMNGIKSDAGLYRSHNVRIHGSYVPIANFHSIEKRMDDFIAFYNSKESRKDLIEFLAKMHAKFEMIHPFSDGNGRVGRLLMLKSCLESGIIPVIILPEQRRMYIEALQRAQLDEKYDMLEQVIIRGIEGLVSDIK